MTYRELMLHILENIKPEHYDDIVTFYTVEFHNASNCYKTCLYEIDDMLNETGDDRDWYFNLKETE